MNQTTFPSQTGQRALKVAGCALILGVLSSPLGCHSDNEATAEGSAQSGDSRVIWTVPLRDNTGGPIPTAFNEQELRLRGITVAVTLAEGQSLPANAPTLRAALSTDAASSTTLSLQSMDASTGVARFSAINPALNGEKGETYPNLLLEFPADVDRVVSQIEVDYWATYRQLGSVIQQTKLGSTVWSVDFPECQNHAYKQNDVTLRNNSPVAFIARVYKREGQSLLFEREVSANEVKSPTVDNYSTPTVEIEDAISVSFSPIDPAHSAWSSYVDVSRAYTLCLWRTAADGKVPIIVERQAH